MSESSFNSISSNDYKINYHDNLKKKPVKPHTEKELSDLSINELEKAILKDAASLKYIEVQKSKITERIELKDRASRHGRLIDKIKAKLRFLVPKLLSSYKRDVARRSMLERNEQTLLNNLTVKQNVYRERENSTSSSISLSFTEDFTEEKEELFDQLWEEYGLDERLGKDKDPEDKKELFVQMKQRFLAYDSTIEMAKALEELDEQLAVQELIQPRLEEIKDVLEKNCGDPSSARVLSFYISNGIKLADILEQNPDEVGQHLDEVLQRIHNFFDYLASDVLDQKLILENPEGDASSFVEALLSREPESVVAEFIRNDGNNFVVKTT